MCANRRERIVVAAVLLLLAVGVQADSAVMPAGGPDWPQFLLADLTDLMVVPTLQSDVLSYTWTILPGATVNGMAIAQVYGVYAVGEPKESIFQVAGSNKTGWKFESASMPGPYAGWEATSAGYYLQPGQSVTLSFDSFKINSGGVAPGVFVRYIDHRGVSQCDYFKDPGTPREVIPEPTALLLALMGGGAAGSLGVVRRRLARG